MSYMDDLKYQALLLVAASRGDEDEHAKDADALAAAADALRPS